MLAVIAVGCVASVVSIACIVAVAVVVQRKRSRSRRRRERSNDDSKTAIDGSCGTGTGGGVDGDGGAADVGGTGGEVDGRNGVVVGGGGGGGGADRHHHRTEAVDDGLEKNPDIIPHDNGKSALDNCSVFSSSAGASRCRTCPCRAANTISTKYRGHVAVRRSPPIGPATRDPHARAARSISTAVRPCSENKRVNVSC